MKTKINLKEVEIKDLNGLLYKVDDLPKQVGNLLFTKSETIEVNDIARILHKGETAEVNEQELSEMLFIIQQNRFYKPFAHQQIIGYFNQKLETLKPKEEKQHGKAKRKNQQ